VKHWNALSVSCCNLNFLWVCFCYCFFFNFLWCKNSSRVCSAYPVVQYFVLLLRQLVHESTSKYCPYTLKLGFFPPFFFLQYQQLKKELEKEFPGKLNISGEGTPQVTGWFEVTVAGKLIHSKKKGDGFVDSDAKRHKIIMAIKAALV
uniref:Selenoprotein W n=1 Tax=Salvator merianae TaxID=96440 RepID=A0A8D0BJ41_SALMN